MTPQEKRRDPRELAAGPSPHTLSGNTTRRLMLEVLIALTPALLFSGLYFYGPRCFLTAGVSALGCVAFETLFCLLTGRRPTVGDLSAVVTGVLLAMCLPANVPLWTVLAGDFFAIVVVKMLFGGLGKNFMNPALGGLVFLFSFPKVMSAVPAVRQWLEAEAAVDAVTAATPMAALHMGEIPAQLTVQEMFTGVRGGAMGEASAALLLLGGLYLVLRGVIRLRIPAAYIGTVALLTYCFLPAGVEGPLQWMLYQLMGGGVLLGAFYMATDPATSPCTKWGQVLYGIGCGGMTVFLRYYGAFPDGVAFAILLMNACAWGLDRWCAPRPYGREIRAQRREKTPEKGGSGSEQAEA